MARDHVFLKIDGSKGPIKGESQDVKHGGEIDLLSWSWGMRSPRDLATHAASARVAYGELVVHKRIDSASTGLMSELATNGELRKVVLSVRRTAIDSSDYLVVTLGKAAITSFELEHENSEDARLNERITLVYETIEFSYYGINTKGDKKGSSTFVGQAGSAH